MENYEIYEDIRDRCGGDIYIGVVGPVRVGKSTFITNFMKQLVLPNIQNKHAKERAIDELPQSAEGKTIMTTQPKFVPNEAVKITVGNNVEMKVRLIDCVGYMITGAMGHEENSKPRLVKTPWSDKEMPFEEAAEIGTRKVIEEHSTIGLVVTTDGSITDIARSNYKEAEEKVVLEMKKEGKPFVMLLNSKKPNDAETKKLAATLEEKYGVPVLAINAIEMTEVDINQIFAKVLLEFPIKSVKVKMPNWLQALSYKDPIIQEIITEIKTYGEGAKKLSDFNKDTLAFSESMDFEPILASKIEMGDGTVYFEILPKDGLFYKVLSKECGYEIKDDFALVTYIKELAIAKKEYNKFKDALAQVKQTGYGIVAPLKEDLKLEEPEVVRQGSRYGVKLKASAPSYHIVEVDIETEVTPMVGTEDQSNEMSKYLQEQFEGDNDSIWETNMFGKSLYSLVGDSINSKIIMMPVEAQRKMRKTLGRIINEGKGGIICILL